MRIGIDAREICGRPTGAGRYLAGLLREWALDETTRRHDFVLYVPEPLTIALDARRFATRLVAGSPTTWWEQVRLPRAARADHLDVFFSPAYSLPLALDVPRVVAIHDLSFVAHPEWFRTREGLRRRWLARESAARAGAVITISEFSRREIIDRLGLVESQIRVIPPGITAPQASSRSCHRGATVVADTMDDAGQRSAAVSAISKEHDDRVLFVGSIFNRRRVRDLVRAFGLMARRRPHTSLDLVGDNRTHPREDVQAIVAAEGLDRRIRWHQFATDEQLADLYARAKAFAFLSEYEGLGLPPLEGLAAGVPPVLLDTPVARESCGGAALYVTKGDLPGTAEALERLLFDEGTRSAILSEAAAALAKYDWKKAAQRTLTLLESMGEMNRI
jgi:glycosyltransferase involved in cell wall biosynthesis